VEGAAPLGRGQTAPSPSLPPSRGRSTGGPPVRGFGGESPAAIAQISRQHPRNGSGACSHDHIRCALGLGRVSPLRSRIPRGAAPGCERRAFQGETRRGWRPTQVSGLGSKRPPWSRPGDPTAALDLRASPKCGIRCAESGRLSTQHPHGRPLPSYDPINRDCPMLAASGLFRTLKCKLSGLCRSTRRSRALGSFGKVSASWPPPRYASPNCGSTSLIPILHFGDGHRRRVRLNVAPRSRRTGPESAGVRLPPRGVEGASGRAHAVAPPHLEGARRGQFHEGSLPCTLPQLPTLDTAIRPRHGRWRWPSEPL
jgi:hypothetical protein